MNEIIAEAKGLSRDIDKLVYVAQKMLGEPVSVDSNGVVWIGGRAFHTTPEGEIEGIVECD